MDLCWAGSSRRARYEFWEALTLRGERFLLKNTGAFDFLAEIKYKEKIYDCYNPFDLREAPTV